MFDICKPITFQENDFSFAQNGERHARDFVCEHLPVDDAIDLYVSFAIFTAQLLCKAGCRKEDDRKERA